MNKKFTKDERYQFEKQFGIKTIVERVDKKILLVQESLTNEWMPGHWGMPGGKPFEKETFLETFNRKMKDEVGKDLKVEGIFKIQELLVDSATVLIFIVVSKVDQDFAVVGDSYKWVDLKEIEKMDTAEFTEFFNKELLLEYLKGEKKTISFDIIDSRKYFEMYEDPDYKKWWNSGKKND